MILNDALLLISGHLKESLRRPQGFSKRTVCHIYIHGEKPTLNLSTNVFIHRLKGAISFPETILGTRQRRAWERLISYIESSSSLSEFDKAAARAEGYVQALVDSEQIDPKSTERELLIIATVDELRRHHSHLITTTTS